MVKMGSKISDKAIEAIAELTGLSYGDVHLKIKEGSFTALAVQALEAFNDKYVCDNDTIKVEPVEDLKILEQCLDDLLREQEEAKSKGNIHLVQELKLDILDLRRRINIEKQQ